MIWLLVFFQEVYFEVICVIRLIYISYYCEFKSLL